MSNRNLPVIVLTLALSAVAVSDRPQALSPGGVRQFEVRAIGPMLERRAAHQATLLTSGKVLVTGGCAADGCQDIQRTAELFDPVTNIFAAATPMSVPRASHAAVALRDGRVFIAGGWTGSSALRTTELYDPAAGRFLTAGDMSEARISPVLTPLTDGRILVTGGERETGVPAAAAEIFDPRSMRFAPAGVMRSPRMSHVAVLLADGRVLIAGGRAGPGQVLDTAEVFDPASGRFEPTGGMRLPRHKHAAVRVDDRHVLIVGGSDARDFGGRYASTEVYDPALGRFGTGPEMRAMRFKMRDAVVVLPSGVVVVAGGAARPEYYDPAVRQFVASAGELGGSQMFATTTLLGTGELLLLGGYDERIRTSASAWRLLAKP